MLVVVLCALGATAMMLAGPWLIRDLVRIFEALSLRAKMSPDRAAEIILDGALAGKPRVLVGLDAHLVHQFGRIAGARYQDVVARLAARTR